MGAPDVTILMTLHREGVVASFTLRSLTDVALYARAKGLSVELVVVLDTPDATTRAVMAAFTSSAFVRIETLEVQTRSLGLNRNAGLAAARGAYTAIVDGDDLYSFNYVAALHAVARGGERIVAHPEHVVWFEEDWLVQRFFSLERSGRFRLAGSHTFCSCILASTDLLREVGYRDCTGSRVFAYEDYDLNCRLVAAGADIRTAPETVFFYRKHGRSIMAEIGDPASRIAPSTALYAPEPFLAASDGDDVIEDLEMLELELRRYRGSHRLAELVEHASRIDPRLVRDKVRDAPIFTTAHFERGFGATYHDLCGRLAGRRFDVVLVVDRLDHCPPSLLRMAETRRCLLLEMARGDMSRPFDPPEGSSLLALDAYDPALPAKRRPEMAVRLLHNFASTAQVHIVLSAGTRPLIDRFSEAFERNAVVLYDVKRDAIDRNVGEGVWTLQSDVFAAVDLVVSDDVAILDTLVAHLPVYAGKVMVLSEGDARAVDALLVEAEERKATHPGEARWTRP